MVERLKLDRKTFNYIQSNLAHNGHESAAGYMVKLAHDFRQCFDEVKIQVDGLNYSAADILNLVNELNNAIQARQITK